MSDESGYEQRVIDWALGYNAYERVGGIEFLEQLHQQLIRESSELGDIPAWVGIDLLRGLAFFLVRWHRHSDDGRTTIFEQFPEFDLILDAVSNHPGARPEDLPPPRPGR